NQATETVAAQVSPTVSKRTFARSGSRKTSAAGARGSLATSATVRLFHPSIPLPTVTKRAIEHPPPAPSSSNGAAPRQQTAFYDPHVPPRARRQRLTSRFPPADARPPTPTVRFDQGRAFNARAP